MKQLPQYMHLSLLTTTLFLSSTVVALMAPVGRDATARGISHIFDKLSLSTMGGLR